VARNGGTGLLIEVTLFFDQPIRPVLHPGRSQPCHGKDHRYQSGENQSPHDSFRSLEVPSREPVKTATQARESSSSPKREPGRYRRGRNVQLNIKVRAEALDSPGVECGRGIGTRGDTRWMRTVWT
jgi:hypothetical protein